MPKVTYACVDCGKERTDVFSSFNKSREEYRCYKCAQRNRRIAIITKMCVDCGKGRTDYRSYFKRFKNGEYRCSNCSGKQMSRNPVWIEGHKRGVQKKLRNHKSKKVTYFCMDCGRSKTSYIGNFTKPCEEYRCKKCAGRAYTQKIIQDPKWKEIHNHKLTYTCIDCGKERRGYASDFNKPRKEYRCQSCTTKNRWKDPDWIASQNKAIQKRSQNLTWLENIKKAGKRRSQDPEYHKMITERNRRMANDPIRIEKYKKSMEKYTRDPMWMEKNKLLWKSPNYIENWLIGIYGEGFWYGNKYLRRENGRKRYCEKWNLDLWRRIDAAWDYQSAISGKTRFKNNGRDLDRHHIYWQEKACCVWDEDAGGYYAMINIGTNRNHEMYKHYIKGDPNKFVLLTRSEHQMIKGKKKLGTNKLTWIKFFEDLIERREKEGKKCYLSPEKYEVYKVENADVIEKYTKPVVREQR